MATDLKKSLANLQDACMLHCFNVEFIDMNENKSMCNSILLDDGHEHVQIGKIHTFDKEDVDMITDLLINYDGIKDVKRVFTNDTMTACMGEYVKDSYQESKYTLADLLEMSMKECSYAVEKWSDVVDKRITHNFKSTESAFIYRGYYITPCIIAKVMNSVLKAITKTSMQMYYDVYYSGNKVKNDTIINDCLTDLFNNDNNERLLMLDDLSGHAILDITGVRSEG